jgi:cytochrome o ubiquinol oxidase subunit 2
VALSWKWLFIYPEQHIAAVQSVRFPVNRPIQFLITADAPMNSFWIPELGGQIYAMTGMSTELNLVADHTGTFAGRSANYSGDGFAQMNFTAEAVSGSDFDAWVESVRQSSESLTLHAYDALAKPSQANPPAYYGNVADTLYDTILMKFMAPARPDDSLPDSVIQAGDRSGGPSMGMPGM